jgi:hypothetical protein
MKERIKQKDTYNIETYLDGGNHQGENYQIVR